MITIADNVINLRTIVDLPDQDRALLDVLCRQRGLSRAAAIREALRLWLQQQQPQSQEVFGLWANRSQDALCIEAELRQEWGR